MPFYEIQHSASLNLTQRSTIAKGITTLYTTTFNAPSLFVNICFKPVNDEDYFTGGERMTGKNRIFVQTRGGGGRSAEVFDKLAENIEQIWEDAVGTDHEKALSGVFIMPGLIAREHGFAVPPVGEDAKWLQENWEEFKRRADEGDEKFKKLISEVDSKPEMLENGKSI